MHTLYCFHELVGDPKLDQTWFAGKGQMFVNRVRFEMGRRKGANLFGLHYYEKIEDSFAKSVSVK